MTTLTSGQLSAVITACEEHAKRWPNEEYINSLEVALRKLRSNHKNRVRHQTRRNARRNNTVDLKVAP